MASDRIRKVKFWKDLFFRKTKIHLESSLLLKTFVCIQCQTFNSIRIASSTSLLKVHIVHPKLVDMFWLRVCHCDLTVQTVLVATKSALRTHYYHFLKLSPEWNLVHLSFKHGKHPGGHTVNGNVKVFLLYFLRKSFVKLILILILITIKCV